MSGEIQSSWMLSPKSFVGLLGAEYHLMRDSGALRRFYISAVLIIIILAVTWISFKYALDLLFNVSVIEITLAIFFSLLFFCIYIFLLNTFAKENRAKKGIFNTSNLIRIGFVAFMGFLVAQPLLISLYSASLAPMIDNYRKRIYNEHTRKISALMEAEENKLVQKQNYYSEQKNKFDTPAYDDDLKKITGSLSLIRQKFATLNQITRQAIERNSFFLFRIRKVNTKNPFSWLLTVLVVVLFLLPGYLVYTMPGDHEYYRLKKARENELIANCRQIATI